MAAAWRPDGQELFFLRPPEAKGRPWMMAADFRPGSPPVIGHPRPLFQVPEGLIFGGTLVRWYEVARNGELFYGVQGGASPTRSTVTHVNLIENWFEELKAKVPIRR
jgi:hypothetical protein